MIKEIRIRNFAIIENLAVNFEKGLNVLTGETGAGKSIIIDALRQSRYRLHSFWRNHRFCGRSI